MPAALLPLVAAVAFAALAVLGHGREPLTQYGEAYEHLPMHLMSVGMSLLLAATVRSLGRAGPPRVRRAASRCAVGWLLVAGAFGLESLGAVWGDGTGENAVHDAGVLSLLPMALVLLVTSLLLAATPALPWALRPVLLVSLPAVPALGEAQDAVALALGLGAAAGWAAVAVVLARRPAVAPEPVPPRPVAPAPPRGPRATR